MHRPLLLVLIALVLAGCPPLPDPNPRAVEPPGFSPCTPNERAISLAYALCAADADFPYETTLDGSVTRRDGGMLLLETEASGSWRLSLDADPASLDEGPDWIGTTEDPAPPVSLTISAPCVDEGEHWFEVTRGGRLLVAGGSATFAEPQGGVWAVGRSPRQDILTSQCESELRSCECWEQCYAIPVGFKYDGRFLAELYPAERTKRGTYDAIVFEAWRGVGEPTCDGARPEEGRWLILGD